jgi:hypothetical protein
MMTKSNDDREENPQSGSADGLQAMSESPQSPALGQSSLLDRLAEQKLKDDEVNAITRPPVEELITLRSMTITEVYFGSELDSLASALNSLIWHDSDFRIADRILGPARNSRFSRGAFWLTNDPTQVRDPEYAAIVELPVGFTKIFGQYRVFGPTLVGLSLTFVLNEEESLVVDAAVRNDAESAISYEYQGGPMIASPATVKIGRVKRIYAEKTNECLDWLRNFCPGSLLNLGGEYIPRSCSLISLVKGEPFISTDRYMSIIGLADINLARSFQEVPALVHTYRVLSDPPGSSICAFNVSEAIGHSWIGNVDEAPDAFANLFVANQMTDCLHLLIRSYVPQLDRLRQELIRLDIETSPEQAIVSLQSRLLTVSRNFFAVANDVNLTLNDPIELWFDLARMNSLRRTDGSQSPDLAEAIKGVLRKSLDSIQIQESELREQILVTSAATSEVRNRELQNKILVLSKRLNALTVVLVVLTIALIGLGIATFFVQGDHTDIVRIVPRHFPRWHPFWRFLIR